MGRRWGIGVAGLCATALALSFAACNPTDVHPVVGGFLPDASDATGPADGGNSRDVAASWQQILSLETVSMAPKKFQPSVQKSGLPLRWQLGDGTTVEANDLTHTYLEGGPKTVRILALDGPLGIEVLTLEGCGLTGALPSNLNQLSNLRELSAGNNALTGPLPAELGDLAGLEKINLYNSGVSGPIPAELGELTSLQALTLNRNSLRGRIPAELGKLTKLHSLSLSSNELTGEIPPELASSRELLVISLDVNRLSGTVPRQFGGLSQLRVFRLYRNRLTGYEPGALRGLISIREIGWQDNDFDQSAVDAIVNDIYLDKGLHTSVDTRTLSLWGGTNAAPSAAALAQIAELEANHGWKFSVNR